MVQPFAMGNLCQVAADNVLSEKSGLTLDECADECLFDRECAFADLEVRGQASTGICRNLKVCEQQRETATSNTIMKKILRQAFNSPQWMMTCKSPVMTTRCMTNDLYDEATKSVKDLFAGLSQICNTERCDVADLGGCILRMAGHDLMDFKDGFGGADACTDMDDPDNAGLPECLFRGEFSGQISINDAYSKFCDRISLADFIVLAGEAVMTMLATPSLQDSWKQGFKDNFRYGRTTSFEGCDFSVGLLPAPEDSCNAVERVYVENMDLTWREAAALMGVHSLGRARPENSGYDGWWSTPDHSKTFNNNYYVVMFSKGWCPKLNVNGCSDAAESRGDCRKKNMWVLCDAYAESEGRGHEMMLDSDMCLVYTDHLGGSLQAKDDPCCAWQDTINPQFSMVKILENDGNMLCGAKCGESTSERYGLNGDLNCNKFGSFGQGGKEFQICCALETERLDCGTTGHGRTRVGGPAELDAKEFAEDEQIWQGVFLRAWKKATENGFQRGLNPLRNQC